MLAPTSLMLGRTSMCLSNSNHRTIQRTNGKRYINSKDILQCEALTLFVAEHVFDKIKINYLGGVVAKNAFYSLCCLRI